MDDKQLIDTELEQLEMEQRQLDLDRKRLQLRLRRAKLCSQVEAVADNGQAEVKPEPVGDGTAVGRIAAGEEPFSDPRLGGATSASTVGDRHVMREEVGPLLHPVERDGIAANLSGGDHSGAPASFDSVTTPTYLVCTKHAVLEPSDETSRLPRPESYPTPSTYRSNSNTTSQMTPVPHRQRDGFGHFPARSPHKRGRSAESESDDFVQETNSTPGAKEVKTRTKDREAERKQNKRQAKGQRLPERYNYAIIRKYGERLVQRHMQSFRRHERWEADQIILAGSKIVDGLLEKRFKSLEELRDEYDRQIRLRCTSSVQEFFFINELQKFRRAAPIWWRKCVKKRTQGERFEDATAVFEDVKGGIFD
ncbi:uncharacterized protein Z519_09951 [Cladophialophora bantiana CBS 173.52]|uniref:Uncharacterized protein n=1 Tax=Cladophialophora bantiana (strain ATCC 10958 / CBS 173.52 / CDC B-1940 / NIH 8579) TaxID=1442370 RepID=A0A0D2HYW5_CLAB1|nr:uncharacterized protein Z519_09951 [Cladophialophora bantiana CBS 173.52]KIW89794.1 hypothetical protein Z519_09951 [Cladophialophora bantiana CBS 173.52]